MERYTLTASDGRTQAEIIPQLGAICSSLRVPDKGSPHELKELLFRPENFEHLALHKICGGLPFHFPACGRTEAGIYTLNHQHYPMPIHGFSAQAAWEIVSLSSHQILLKLTHSENTLLHYPFHFELRLGYEIHPNTLKISITVVNHDAKPMPFSMGFHPYFYIPVREKSQTHIDFQAIKSIAYNETLSDLADEQDIQSPMPAALTAEGLNERLSVLGENTQVTLIYPQSQDTSHHLTLETGGIGSPNPFQFLQLYHNPAQPFFCIEPWAGTPNSLNHPERLLLVAPEKSLSAWLTLKWQEK